MGCKPTRSGSRALSLPPLLFPSRLSSDSQDTSSKRWGGGGQGAGLEPRSGSPQSPVSACTLLPHVLPPLTHSSCCHSLTPFPPQPRQPRSLSLSSQRGLCSSASPSVDIMGPVSHQLAQDVCSGQYHRVRPSHRPLAGLWWSLRV